jgi:hypothetical protein
VRRNTEGLVVEGVGFYSVFSLTDSPAVRSGSKGLLIFWEGEVYEERTYERKKEKGGVRD